MARLNKPRTPIHTHEGAKASHVGQYEQLERTVMSCMLWEKTFYEDGVSVADRIKATVPLCSPPMVAELAVRARTDMHLRHVPLLLMRELARHPQLAFHDALVAGTLPLVIQRADELTEFMAIYWKDGKCPVSKQVKVGLAEAFTKFSAYSLAKYNRKNEVKLKDVMFLVHPKGKDMVQQATFDQLANDTLAPPDTWEVALSGGADKKESFTRLLNEGKLGYMALLRNLRKMTEVGVDPGLIKLALISGAERSKALPFRFIAAAKHASQFEPQLDGALQIAVANLAKLPGHTVLLVDVSWSMQAALSTKSEMNRADAACGLAMLLAGIGEEVTTYSFSNRLVLIPPRQGMALRDAIMQSQENSGTQLWAATRVAMAQHPKADRTIIITDEQAAIGAAVPPVGKGYIMNVASFKNGVGYGPWTHIHGFSEQCVNFIMALEAAGEDLQ